MASITVSFAADVESTHPHAIFHPFARLPPELRYKIWIHYLEDATPQMYMFTLRFPERTNMRTGDNFVRADDRLFLQPWECSSGPVGMEKDFLGLKNRMLSRHIASATCTESRQAFLELFPDTLKFRHLPREWGWIEWAYTGPGKLTGSPYPEHTLRFNGAKDIFIFHTDWVAQSSVVRLAALRGSPFQDFLNIRHVGIPIDKFRKIDRSRPPLQYGTRACRTGCQTEVCQDYCQKEPLVDFLSLFPLLSNFYIADVPGSNIHQPDEQRLAGKKPTGGSCPCPTSGLRHSWPVIRSSDTCGWFTIYDERSGCLLPKLDRVEELRQHWRAHFPYYKALDHLEIRFIQSAE
jgi:hypothetical protein